MVYLKKAYFENYVFDVDEHVYETAEDSFLIAEKIAVNENDTVLDMGTGCGILAIICAKRAKHVVAVDINPYAIKCARKNAKAFELTEKMVFLQGDLFGPIKNNEKFSLILFNSPYLPSEPGEENSWIGKAWAGGSDGRKIIDRFIADVPHWLTDQGHILLVQSSLSDPVRTIEMFTEQNLHAQIISQVKFPFESIILIEAKF
ncbi:MAG: methyltransferase [Candidatus Bathyarchaeota archaeon]|nr:class I SAM-dependent methyltransferase [Candidatus Bathyarchaeum tardum]WGM90535.1 MAG: class I SAM-dependent methyltransferase [Candidatus Bathyarchaeum tardum]WNZ29390.1 MAG: methyltransferase [Candidatus Bathyarchaeota archaeon]